MPYSTEHKRKSREKILHAASRLFSRRGYDAVSLDEVMAEADLTRGAFYNHFQDKADLYARAIPHAALNNAVGKDIARRRRSRDNLNELVERYLSREHLDDADPPCPLAFLVTDVGIRDERVRDAYTQMHGQLVRLVQRMAEGDREMDINGKALATTALLIGGIAIGRALSDAQTVDALLASCRASIYELLAE